MELSDPFSPSVYTESDKILSYESGSKELKGCENSKINANPRKRNTTFGTMKEKIVFPRLSHNLGKENKSKEIPLGRAKGASSDKKKSLKSRALKSLSVSAPGSKAAASSSSCSSSPPPPIAKKKARNSFKIFSTEEENDNTIKMKRDDGVSEREKGCPSPEYDSPGNFSLAENRDESVKVKKYSSRTEIEKFLAKRARKPLCRFLTYEETKDEERDFLIEDYTEIGKMEKLRESYKERFTQEKILKIVRDPWIYFSDKERDCTGYSDHSLYYLKTKFRKHYNQIISDALLFHNHNLYLAYKYLTKKNRGLKLRASNRPLSECIASQPDWINPQFLLEVMFIESEEDLKIHMRNLKAGKTLRLRDAKKLDKLAHCGRCREGDLIAEDVIICNQGHSFCKNCIVKYFESKIARGSFCINCLYICEEKYPLTELQDLLDIETFSKLVEMYQIFESNDIPGLIQCPFCKCFRIEPEKDNIIMCLNPKCLLIYCRECKEVEHEPEKCKISENNEVELKCSSLTSKIGIQKCWKCEYEVVKEEGCNEMMCPCGGRTCYVCKNPVEDHSHFFLYEDEDGSKCPLYATDFRTELDLF